MDVSDPGACLEETLDILSDPEALAEIRRAEFERGRGETTSEAEMAHLMEERRRRETDAG